MVVIVLCQRRYRCNCAIVIACDLHAGDSSIECMVFEIYDAFVSHDICRLVGYAADVIYDDRYVMRIRMLRETFRDGHYSPRCFAGYWVWVETASCRWV